MPLVAIFCGCSLNIPPPDQISDPDAITNVSTARSLLTSAYISYPHYEYQLSILEIKNNKNEVKQKVKEIKNTISSLYKSDNLS